MIDSGGRILFASEGPQRHQNIPGKGKALELIKESTDEMLSTVLLHMVESTVPVNFKTSLDSLLDWGAGVVDMAGTDPLDVLDIDRFIDGTIVARLSSTFGEEATLSQSNTPRNVQVSARFTF